MARDHKDLEIHPLQESELRQAHDIKVEYLEDGSFEAWSSDWKSHPELTVSCLFEGQLIGVAYGRPSPQKDGDVILEGIAVIQPHAGQGIGSQLLHFFERQAEKGGHSSVSLGSAGGYVEHFYMKNGYRPVEFVCWVSADYDLPVALKHKFGLADEPLPDDTRRLSVSVQSLDNELRDRLMADLGVADVVAIMEKDCRIRAGETQWHHSERTRHGGPEGAP